jgi:hypothetical protein
MDIDSESSCTYKDYMIAYSSTRDSELWHTQYAIGTEVNLNLGIERMPIMLCDETPSEDITEIPFIGTAQMEEILMEPLLSVPVEQLSIIQSIVSMRKGSLLVSASTYGLKHLVFSIPGCMLCTKTLENPTEISIYVPRRFLRKIVSDCSAQGVECESSTNDTLSLYHHIPLTQSPEVSKDSIRNSQIRILSNGNYRPVTRSVTPVFADGFKFYYPVSMTVLIVLNSQKHIKMEDESGNIVVHRMKRQIKVVPLCISEPIGHGNDVALRTSPL